MVNEIIAEKNLIIVARDNEVQKLQNQLAKANKSAKKKKTETLGENTKSLQEVEVILTDLNTERERCAMMQANYEKVCSEKNDLASKFDDLAHKIGEALEATNEVEGDMIHVDLVESIYALYKKKAAMLKDAKEMIADLCSKQKPIESKRVADTVCQVISSNAKALNELTDDEQKRTLFIGGFPESIEYDEVLQYVSQFGTVQQISTPNSGGITKAFVIFADAVPAQNRLQLGQKNAIKGSPLHIQRFHQSYIKNPAKYKNRYLVRLIVRST